MDERGTEGERGCQNLVAISYWIRIKGEHASPSFEVKVEDNSSFSALLSRTQGWFAIEKEKQKRKKREGCAELSIRCLTFGLCESWNSDSDQTLSLVTKLIQQFLFFINIPSMLNKSQRCSNIGHNTTQNSQDNRTWCVHD